MSAPHLAEPLIGFFGKLPSKGDFVRRSLPSAFIDPYDSWLQQVISAAKDSLGADEWLQRYLSSRIWRFCLPSGTFDNQVWLGAVMPSVDKVNRYFPLTIAAAVPESADPVATVRANTVWFSHVQALLYRALDEEALDLENFAATVQLSAPRPVSKPAAMTNSAHWREVELNAESDGSDAEDDRLFDNLLVPLAQTQLALDSTLWWAEAPQGEQAKLLIFTGLPSAQGYVRLLGDNVAPMPHAQGQDDLVALGTGAATDQPQPNWIPEDSEIEEDSGRSLDEMFGESPDPSLDPDDTQRLDVVEDDADDTEVLKDNDAKMASLDSLFPESESDKQDSE